MWYYRFVLLAAILTTDNWIIKLLNNTNLILDDWKKLSKSFWISDVVVLFPIIYLNYLKNFIIVYTNLKTDFQ